MLFCTPAALTICHQCESKRPTGTHLGLKVTRTTFRYEAICEPPSDRFMIFDVERDQPAVVDGVLLIGLSRQDAEWVRSRLETGETLNRKYLEALKSIADRHDRQQVQDT